MGPKAGHGVGVDLHVTTHIYVETDGRTEARGRVPHALPIECDELAIENNFIHSQRQPKQPNRSPRVLFSFGILTLSKNAMHRLAWGPFCSHPVIQAHALPNRPLGARQEDPRDFLRRHVRHAA